ncbi:uncharacterized protein LOC118413296 [Branchiostoma floridae]|uniref:Uncharacterized protein LOC118413296 n=1 Tax=Branchiostoma floridae TaxID=7739 RepID=C3XZQ1_BRAFL|nr:uncharacterized protein LOC118413296 [Branchiostoma floridae]|eukprot:XP_002610439.1 hypothetical protein BRAFLDRAFT_124260 [Branchiostoma floridae]
MAAATGAGENILDANSPANKYLLELLDEKGMKDAEPSEQRMITVFRVLDDLLPHLGHYSKIAQLIRDELYDAVYSPTLTSTAAKQPVSNADATTFIQKVPYFTLVKRVYDERNMKAEDLQDKLDAAKERLREKQQQFQALEAVNDELRQDIEGLNDTVEGLESEIQARNQDIKKLHADMEEDKNGFERAKASYEQNISNLRADIRRLTEELNYMTQYKTNFDKMQEAFHTMYPTDSMPKRMLKRKPVLTSKKANLVTDIENVKRLESQMLSIQNSLLEEFDAYMEAHLLQLSSCVQTDNVNDPNYSDNEMQIDKLDVELQCTQERFQASVAELGNELALIRQHKDALTKDLQDMEEARQQQEEEQQQRMKTPGSGRKSGRPGSKPGSAGREGLRSRGRDSAMSLQSGLDEEEKAGDGGASDDPFSPHEHILSKYSAMLYFSTNFGRNFEEFKEGAFCPSCGEKTVICPHKVTTKDKVFILPKNCTHIKVVRPKLRVNIEVSDTVQGPQQSEVNVDGKSKSAASVSSTRRMSQTSSNQGVCALHSDQETPGDSRRRTSVATSANLLNGDSSEDESTIKNTTQQIWVDYRKRSNIARAVARPLSQERVLSIIEQFYATLVFQDDCGMDDEPTLSFVDALYAFFSERYLDDEVTYLAAYDFLTGVVQQVNISRTVHMFALLLAGHLDASTMRYIVTVADLIEAVEWKEVRDFEAFAECIYPFLQEDEIETVSMSYQSFSENKISKTLVIEWVMNAILRGREPRMKDAEVKLFLHPGKEPGSMTEGEFANAMESICPLASDKLRMRLFAESSALLKTSAVDVSRLTPIAGYLMFLQILPLLKDSIGKRVAKARSHPRSGTVPVTKMEFETRIVMDKGRLMKMSTLRSMANNVARRKRARGMRRIAKYQGMLDDD